MKFEMYAYLTLRFEMNGPSIPQRAQIGFEAEEFEELMEKSYSYWNSMRASYMMEYSSTHIPVEKIKVKGYDVIETEGYTDLRLFNKWANMLQDVSGEVMLREIAKLNENMRKRHCITERYLEYMKERLNR